MASERPTGKAVLAVLLQAGFYLLGWGLVAGLLYLPVAEVVYDDIFSLGGIGAVAVALSLGWALLPPRSRWEAPGILLDPAAEPALFEHLRDLGGQAGLQVPAEIYLLNDANAFIGSRRVWGRRRRIMGLGLPLMKVLTVGELRAVIAHEYGHEHRGDLTLGPWVHGTRRAMGAALEKMDDDGVGLHLFFHWYARLYMRLSYEVSRVQELHADELAGQFCGRQDACSALHATDRAGSVWWAYWHHEIVPVLQRGYRPPLLDGFTTYLESEPVRKRLDELQAAAEPAGEYDSHPSLPERKAALQVAPDHGPGDARPAVELLESVDRSEAALLTSLLTSGSLEPIEWTQVGSRVWLPFWRDLLQPYFSSLARLDPSDLGTVRFSAWVDRLRPQGPNMMSPDAAARRVRELLSMWLCLKLADRGFECVCSPGDPVRMVRQEQTIEPFAVLIELEKGTLSAAAWRETWAAV